MAGVGRGIAPFLGGFAILNVLGPGLQAWWLDLRAATDLQANVLPGLVGILPTWHRVHPSSSPRGVVRKAALFAWLIVERAAPVARRERKGIGTGRVGFRRSLCGFGGFVWGLVRRGGSRREEVLVVCMAAGCVMGFPLPQMVCFGRTNHTQNAGAVVVFGACIRGRVTLPLVEGPHGHGAGPPLSRKSPNPDLFGRTWRWRDPRNRGGAPLGRGARSSGRGHPAGRPWRGHPKHDGECGRDPARAEDRPRPGREPRLSAARKVEFQNLGVEARTVPARESYRLTLMPYCAVREVAASWVRYRSPA